jgi:hypothetical protein
MKNLSIASHLCLCAALVGLGLPALRAQAVVADFNSGDDAAWAHIDPLGNAIYSFPDGDSYRIQAPMPATGDFGSARAGAYLSGLTVTDFHITVDLLDWDNSAGTHQAIGIFARGQGFGLGSTDGYFFHYDPFGSNGNSRIWIECVTDEVPSGNNSALVNIPLDPLQNYRLEFIGIGDELTGRVYDLNNLSEYLFEVSFTDSTYTSGQVGLLVADQGSLFTGNQSADATFDNFSVTAIPEPMTTTLLSGAAIMLVAVCRRRSRP